MSFCNHCGKPIQDGVKFCTNCGSPTFNPKNTQETQARTAHSEKSKKAADNKLSFRRIGSENKVVVTIKENALELYYAFNEITTATSIPTSKLKSGRVISNVNSAALAAAIVCIVLFFTMPTIFLDLVYEILSIFNWEIYTICVKPLLLLTAIETLGIIYQKEFEITTTNEEIHKFPISVLDSDDAEKLLAICNKKED